VSDLYHETAEPAGRDYGGYPETDAEVQARIASQDELPTREESRQATWGDDPDYYGETDPGAEYDGDADVFLAGEDELPTPQESRARTWGDDPEYYDEADLASEYDGDLGSLTTEEDSPAARHAPAGPGTADTHAESAIAPEDAAGNRDQATADPSTDARAVVSEGDDGDVLSPEADRFKALEAENDAARQEIADLKAELKAVKDEHAARFDRIEQLLTSADRQPGATDTPEHVPDQPGATRDQDASLDNRLKSEEQRDSIDSEPGRWRRIVSSENAGIASTLIGATGTVSEFAMHPTLEGVVGMGGMILGLISLGLAKAEKHRKGKA
jgi:hypothetical protein